MQSADLDALSDAGGEGGGKGIAFSRRRPPETRVSLFPRPCTNTNLPPPPLEETVPLHDSDHVQHCLLVSITQNPKNKSLRNQSLLSFPFGTVDGKNMKNSIESLELVGKTKQKQVEKNG